MYLRGLLAPGERKRVRPLAARDAPGDGEQGHHFVCASGWDPAPWSGCSSGRPSGRPGAAPPLQIGWRQWNLGNLACDEGDAAAARPCCQEALAIAGRLKQPSLASIALLGSARWAAAAGQPANAARFLGAATAMREARQHPWPPIDLRDVDRAQERIRAALSPAALETRLDEGRRLNAWEAVALALAVLESPAAGARGAPAAAPRPPSAQTTAGAPPAPRPRRSRGPTSRPPEATFRNATGTADASGAGRGRRAEGPPGAAGPPPAVGRRSTAPGRSRRERGRRGASAPAARWRGRGPGPAPPAGSRRRVGRPPPPGRRGGGPAPGPAAPPGRW